MGLKYVPFRAVVAAGLLVTGPLLAQSPQTSGLSLDQAVLRAQQQAGGGKVLSAEPRQLGRREEYRIKVLTPEGHVRVLSIPSDSAHPAPAASTFKKVPPNGGSKKEKH